MSILIHLYIATQLIILPYLTACAQTSFQEPFHWEAHPESVLLDDDFTDWLEKTGYEWGMKGVSIAVTRRLKDQDGNWAGWTSETKGYGIADRLGNPVDADTLFAIGSNSKLFTAIGVGLITENDTLPIMWETKIKDILPENLWKLQDTVAQNEANFIDILSHRTGLPRHDLSYSRTDSLTTAISKLRYLKSSAEFRDIWQYNNQMYFVAAYIIQHVTGIPFPRFITENIIMPLGMDATTYSVDKAQLSGRLADGFVSLGTDEDIGEGKRKIVFKPVPFWNVEHGVDLMAGPGGVTSTANDLIIWLQMLLLNGKHPVTRATIVPESVIHRAASDITSFRSPSKSPELSTAAYGMGQIIHSYQGHNLVEHNGAVIGHTSLITRAPDDGVGIAILTNTNGNDPFLNLVKFRLLEKALGLKEVDWSSRFSKEENEQAGATSDISQSSQNYIRDASSLPVQDLAGAYFNPAYGTISLCDFQVHVSSPKASAAGCRNVIEDIAMIHHGPPPALVAAWPKLWSTHLLLYHQDKNLFNISAIIISPPPFPNSTRSENGSHPFAAEWGQGSANFVFTSDAGADSQRVDGIAITGAWGPGSGVKPLSGTDRDSAEVWFDRVI